ncbi:ZmpA/ZmpB/ZmpC family metallo-endopeptidase [Mycoplasma sp. OR1901]|uniref:ZmpA/ZmpB/ZmpC family metallo-endopeptidase n=1 Tax=Mycoplasma sp. OR1901 TaxID=2742195 RepID=UPI00158311DF|nr:ZmpA/ZmpB/ZmpC family metallo-endopeptidase [Mycoplasma sp. OR1901]QKT05161.1 hypothetical protein HTZ87_00300 [Mycoplasma sp. OR1901]
MSLNKKKKKIVIGSVIASVISVSAVAGVTTHLLTKKDTKKQTSNKDNEQNATFTLNGATLSSNDKNTKHIIGDQVQFALVIPTGKKVSEIRINDKVQTITLSNENTFNWVIKDKNTKVEVTYVDLSKYSVNVPNNVTVTNENINLNSVVENTILNFNIQVPSGQQIQTLTVNNQDYKNQVNNDSFNVQINSNTVISIVFEATTDLGGDKEVDPVDPNNNTDGGNTVDPETPNNGGDGGDSTEGSEVDTDTGTDSGSTGNNSETNEIEKEIPEEKAKESTLTLTGFTETNKTVEQNKIVTLNLEIPANNHIETLMFDGVDKTSEIVNGQFSFTPNKDTHNVSATYSLNKYSLTLNSTELSLETNVNKTEIPYNNEVTININVPEGKKIDELIVNGSNKRKQVTSENKFVFNIKNNTEISVKFKDAVTALKKYSLTLGEGLVTSSDIDLQNILGDKVVRVFFDIPSGQEVSTLTINGEDNLANIDDSKAFIDITMNESKNVNVTFKNRENSGQQNITIFVNKNNDGSRLYIYQSGQTIENPNAQTKFRENDIVLFKIKSPSDLFEAERVEITNLFNLNEIVDVSKNIWGDFVFFKVVSGSMFNSYVDFKQKPKKVVDKSKLIEAVRLAEEKKKSSTYIYEKNNDVKNDFDEKLTNSKELNNNENATEEEVALSTELLLEAMDNLSGEYNKKSLDFKDIKSVELFKINNGAITKVAGLNGNDLDKNNYLVKIQDSMFVYELPVKQIVRNNGKYDITVNNEKLAYFNSNNDAIEHFTFSVEEIINDNSVITSFSQLVTKINANPSNEFIIGSDLYAENTNGDSYITNKFTGKLKSVDGKKFTIHGLNKPLFNEIHGATLENFKIDNSTIQLTKSGGALAVIAKDFIINNLEINANVNYRAVQKNNDYVGGLFGSTFTTKDNPIKASLNRNIININFIINGISSPGQYFGLLTSQTIGGVKLDKNYFLGEITNNQSTKNNTGLLLGKTWNYDVLNENLINVIYNDNNNKIFSNWNDTTMENNYIVTDNINDDTHISKDKVHQKLLDLGIIKNEAKLNNFDKVNYSKVNNYDNTREVAYKNMAKLLPLHDRNTIVELGNLVSTSDVLFTKEINNVVPLDENNNFATNLYNKEAIKKIFVKFNDNTIQVYDLSAPVQFENTNIYEYTFNNVLKFSPRQFLNKNDQLINELVQEFSSLDLNSNEFQTLVDLAAYNTENKTDKITMQYLYLNDAFSSVKKNIKDYLESIIANYNVADYSNENIRSVIKKEILDNKHQIMLALTYLDRLYKVQFGKYNIKNLVLFRPDFYNSDIKNIDLLKEIGSLKFKDLLLQNNDEVFKKHLAKLNKDKSGTIFDFLEMNNEIFNNNQNMGEWLKESSKAYIYELKSTKFDTLDISLYSKLKKKASANRFILPLLNLKEDNVYVISTLATMYFGGYGRSIDEKIWHDKEQYDVELEKTKNKIRVSAEKFMKFTELLYSISNEAGRNELENTIVEVFDGYWVLSSENGQPIHDGWDIKRRWASAFDQNYTAINDFFGPIGRYYNQSPRKESGYANQFTKLIKLDSVNMLEAEGAVTITHELTHAYDRKTWLQNNEYRPGQGPEAFALGLFESVSSKDAYFYGFNFIEEINGPVTTNNNISRFNDKNDFQTYLHNLFDVTYLIDGLEAEVLLSMNEDAKSKFFAKLEMSLDTNDMKTDRNFYRTIDGKQITANDIDKGYHHANDKWVDATIEDISSLRTLNDLIDKNIIFKGNKFNVGIDKKLAVRDNDFNYYWISMFDPIYAAYQNDKGVTGGLTFRRNAFELLAEYGWDNGFVKYTSNVLEKGLQQGEILSDTYVYKNIFGSKYNKYSDFRKAMYQERLAKKDSFNPITVTYNNKAYKLTNAKEIQDLLRIAINDDLLKPKFGFIKRESVKKDILTQFNLQTDNFRTSIFKANK